MEIQIPAHLRDDYLRFLKQLERQQNPQEPAKEAKPCNGCQYQKGTLQCSLASMYCRNSRTKPYHVTLEEAEDRRIHATQGSIS